LSKSALYQTITVSSGFFVYGLGFIQMYILTPIECFYFGTLFILLAILRNRIGNRTKGELSLEIDHNLKLLHKFWEKFQGFLSKPLSISECFRRTTQVVIGQSPTETAKIGFIESEVLSCWHRKIFDTPTSLNSLSVDKQQNVRQFYDNLDAITSIYGKVIKLGDKVVGRTNINEKLEDLVVKVLEQGNPLKATYAALQTEPPANPALVFGDKE